MKPLIPTVNSKSPSSVDRINYTFNFERGFRGFKKKKKGVLATSSSFFYFFYCNRVYSTIKKKGCINWISLVLIYNHLSWNFFY